LDQSAVLPALLTTIGTLFVTELSDKDALFLLALATRARALLVFAAGSIAFTVTTAIIVLVGSVLITLVPVIVIKVAGGAIMLGYALWEYYRLSTEKDGTDKQKKERIPQARGTSQWSIFFPALLSLIVLDLAGDATELVTVVLLARFDDALIVFLGAVTGLIAAVAVETTLGNRLGRVLSPRRIKWLSIIVFSVIGVVVIVTSLLGT
jgi:putative Ca2+/H+ antiporter (TMEM165/GDT1 family)